MVAVRFVFLCGESVAERLVVSVTRMLSFVLVAMITELEFFAVVIIMTSTKALLYC